MAEISYERAVAYIDSIPRFTKKNDGKNTRELLRRLGNPDQGLPIIHVAGTNGKGSVCAMLESIYRTSGLRMGLFTSPHLVRLLERFQIDRREVSEEAFLQAFGQVMDKVHEMQREGLPHPTYFEILFVIGMILFRMAEVDLLLLETGLGGRLDATNVVDPILSVITSISLDHMEYLGSTIPEIAFEKAGIIKPGVPVVYDGGNAEASEVIEKRARELGSPAFPFWHENAEITSCTDRSIRFTLKIPGEETAQFQLEVPFLAEYQVQNASLAVTAALALRDRIPVSRDTILEGIRTARWSGRMEVFEGSVVIDGAHNEDGIRQFLRTVKRISGNMAVSLLFAALKDKDVKGMVREICRQIHFDSVVTVTVDTPRAVPARELAELFSKEGEERVYFRESAPEGLRLALSLRPEGGLLFCAGSLYLAGELQAEFERRKAAEDRFGGKDDQL